VLVEAEEAAYRLADLDMGAAIFVARIEAEACAGSRAIEGRRRRGELAAARGDGRRADGTLVAAEVVHMEASGSCEVEIGHALVHRRCRPCWAVVY
jgi:hypothetical protein